jgi:hypothetical protein
MINTVGPLRPPLAAPEGKQREALPSAGNGKPAPAAAPRVSLPSGAQSAKSPPFKLGAGSGAASDPPSNHDANTKPPCPLTCRECRTKTPWPAAGWYTLDRRIIPGSVPPDILTEAERRAWAHSRRQGMVLYCSMACLRRSMERLEGLDRMFRREGHWHARGRGVRSQDAGGPVTERRKAMMQSANQLGGPRYQPVHGEQSK